MNRFTVDFSSSIGSDHLPSNSPQQQHQRRNVFSLPDDVTSTTPAAPPPSQIFGSSQTGTGVSKLQFERGTSAFTSSAPRPPSFQHARAPTSGPAKSRLFEMSTNTYATDEEDPEYMDDMMEDDVSEYEDENDFNNVKNTAPSLLKFSTNSMRKSFRQSANRMAPTSRSRLPRKGRPDIVPNLARDLSRSLGTASLTEPDEIIVGTEEILRGVDEECQRCSDDNLLQQLINTASRDLVSGWQRRSRFRSSSTGQNTIGPDSKATPFEKAQYVATLLFELHQSESESSQASLVYPGNKTTGNAILISEVLLDWLDKYHVNYGPLFEQVINTSPTPTANELYWDAIESFVLRGKFEEVMELLRRGDLNYAVIDTPDGPENASFSGTQLQQAEDAVYRARQLINTCPVFQSGDWQLEGQEWSVYRKQLEAEIAHLADQVDSSDQVSHKNTGLFSKPIVKSGLPFVIYQRLKTVYSIMLGDADEIIGLAQDWVEASILLTVWWAPSDEKSVAKWSFDVSRANDASALDPYIKRLSDSFLCVTDPESDTGFQLNTMDPVEIGIGCTLQGDIQSALRILSSLSLSVASSVAELGTWSGWLTSPSTSTDFDQDDLMVLNYGSNDSLVQKDDILEMYARQLFDRSSIKTQDGGEVEGWELSFSILSRLDDQDRTHATVSALLGELPVSDQERTAKLVGICEQFGLEEEGRKVSETFADSLVKRATDYGTALLCYARAHAGHKVRSLIDVLNSYCLVQSTAYPPEHELDSALAQLVSSPKSALQHIADADPQAAEILQFYLVGYACLRRFYSLRDDPKTKTSLAKRRAAAKALIAAINSAADSIYGGLYDPNRQSAIQVDGLLTMLGEVTVFLGDGRRALTCDQMYELLATVEDLQTVSDRVYQAAEECMKGSLQNYHGSQPPSPHAMLKKSISSGTNSNFSFSMMGSEMLARSEESLGGNSFGSAVLVGKGDDDVPRGWDWRSQFKNQGTTGADVLKHLRLSIADELSVAMVEEGSFIS